MAQRANGSGLSSREITTIVNRYIGVYGGYLGDNEFSYRTLEEFYPEFCDLELDPYEFLPADQGTTRSRFIAVLEGVGPLEQAKIIRGLLEKCPPGSSDLRTQEKAEDLRALADRLEGQAASVDLPPLLTSDVVSRALTDAEALIASSGPASALDRVHTALHGHLRYLCEQADIAYEREDTITTLLKKLRLEHPKFQDEGARAQEFRTVLPRVHSLRRPPSAMTSQGSASGRLSRALKTRNLWAAEMSLRELGTVSLADAPSRSPRSSSAPPFAGTGG